MARTWIAASLLYGRAGRHSTITVKSCDNDRMPAPRYVSDRGPGLLDRRPGAVVDGDHGPMTTPLDPTLADDVTRAIAAAPTGAAARDIAVALLKTPPPRLHVGRHLPARRRRARARAVSRQALAAHAHPARPRHLRRRRDREGDDRRRRREQRPAVPGVQPRDEVRDRRADHARTARCSARSTSTATRPPRSGHRPRAARARRDGSGGAAGSALVTSSARRPDSGAPRARD